MASDWFEGNGGGQAVDAVKLLDSKVGEGVAQLVELGALVSMGKTSDGGALGITVTLDGRWRREYFRDEDAAIVWLAEAIPAIAAAVERQTPSAAPRSRSRRSGTR
jgi:hypothetical protein